MIELGTADKHVFQMEQIYDKLPHEGHGFLPFLGFARPGNRDGVYDLQRPQRKLHFLQPVFKETYTSQLSLKTGFTLNHVNEPGTTTPQKTSKDLVENSD